MPEHGFVRRLKRLLLLPAQETDMDRPRHGQICFLEYYPAQDTSHAARPEEVRRKLVMSAHASSASYTLECDTIDSIDTLPKVIGQITGDELFHIVCING